MAVFPLLLLLLILLIILGASASLSFAMDAAALATPLQIRVLAVGILDAGTPVVAAVLVLRRAGETSIHRLSITAVAQLVSTVALLLQ